MWGRGWPGVFSTKLVWGSRSEESEVQPSEQHLAAYDRTEQ